MIWIIIVVVISSLEILECSINRTVCCGVGRQFAETAWKTHRTNLPNPSDICSLRSIKGLIIDFNPKDIRSIICMVHARSCCIKTSKTAICQYGASQLETCDSPSIDLPLVMNQIKMECCLCCRENNSISIMELESCSLLNRKCPRDENETERLTSSQIFTHTVSMVTEAKRSSDVDTESLKLTESGGMTTVHSNADEQYYRYSTAPTNEGESSESPRPLPSAASSTNVQSYPFHSQSSMKSPHSSVKPMTKIFISTVNELSSNKTSNHSLIICESGKRWDPKLQVCLQMVISCPKNLILHPNKLQCVPIISPKIPCLSGFVYDQFKAVCVDVNECETNEQCKNKSEICVNTVGSFKCECQKGFKTNKLGVCEDIDECINLDLCTNEKKCRNTVGSYQCVRAIPCGFGWKEDPDTNECIDVDECDAFPGICGPGMKCVNIRGSHRCDDDECPNNMKRNNKGLCSRCRDGFFFNNKTNQCEDIDECSVMVGWYNGQCKETEICNNLLGSYECIPKKKCRIGTVLSKNGMYCEDIDECKEMKFRCESNEICVNTFASYQCVASPCAPSQRHDYVTRKCVCQEGYVTTEDDLCKDIDECQSLGSESVCGSNFMCINYPGSYSCIHRSECPTGMYQSSPHTLCQDVDECETGEGKCPSNMHCVNIVGSYKCMCNRGFIMMGNNTCFDVDECALFRPEESCPDLEAKCVNIPGSYKCQCPKGFQWTEYPIKKCMDINECLDKNPCGKRHECINIIGSFKCKCFQGYRLSISGDSCEDINECLLEPKKCINGFCLNVPGTYTCTCPPGFSVDRNEICQDIDECSSIDDVCSKEEDIHSSKMCINLFGYYKCVNSSCTLEYSRTETGNGFLCTLNERNHCILSNVNCLLSKPYRKSYEYIEVAANKRFRVITRFDISHLPFGGDKISLEVKYAQNIERKEPISVHNVFDLKKNRNLPNTVEIVIKKTIPPPAEVLLHLQVKKYHHELYLGHSQAFIYLYFTNYPKLSVSV